MPRKRAAVTTRAPATPTARISKAKALAIEEFLMTHYAIRRPPGVTARLLAMIIDLHQHGRPFPSRAVVAEQVGCTIFGIDAALSVALARELITLEVKTARGNVAARESAIRERYYVPSKQLLMAAASGARAAA